MHPTSSHLQPASRSRICAALLASLADGADLYTQIKTAHWNVKGPHFAALHPLFDTFAAAAQRFNDEIAERAVALGAMTGATARRVAKASRLAEYPADATDGLEHASHLVERFTTYLEGVRSAREVADDLGDVDTVDLLTEVASEFEKHAWFLHATLEDSAGANSGQRRVKSHSAAAKSGAAERALVK